ncbi:MAG: hypothetical protein U9O96_05740 [Candidatus Thermoplasmatota archaeon]|nr:hypothetical protein [Candidatus Thermoplasmatota archaeon]
MKKITIALLIAGLFVLPVSIIPSTNAATEIKIRGDVIYGEMYYPIQGIPEWHHACFYRGQSYSKEIIQSDPHWENWTPAEKLWFLWARATGSGYYFWKVHNSIWDRGVGGVEYETLSYIHNTYADVAYGRVSVQYDWQRDLAVSFAEDKEDDYYNGYRGRPFDIVSYWVYNNKQIGKDVSPNNHNPAYGYYCAELVWAGYKDRGIELDSDGGRVTPKNIYDNTWNYYDNVNW